MSTYDFAAAAGRTARATIEIVALALFTAAVLVVAFAIQSGLLQ